MSEPVYEPAGQLHEEQCFACWLRAIGVDPQLGSALLSAAFSAGCGAGAAAVAAAVGVPPQMSMLIIGAAMPQCTPTTMAAIERAVRARMAVPPSLDVAEAMGLGHG